MRFVAILALTAAIGLAVASPTADAQVRTRRLTVQVRTGPIRESPSFLGRVLGSAGYGDRVELVETRTPWMRVRHGSLEGWMHESALTTRRLTMQAGEGDAEVTATAEELALAGKGFTEEVEAEFRIRNREVDFAWVDRMETFGVGEAEMRAFLNEGRVVPAERARP